METQLERKDLYLPDSKHSTTYEIDTFRFIKSPEEPVENRIQIKARKSFVRKDDIGYLYTLEILDRAQSNRDDILSVEDSLAILQHNLTLYTNEHGEVISVVNRKEIFEKWYHEEAIFRKANKGIVDNIDQLIAGVDAIINDPVAFLNIIKKSEVVMLLFPPIYQLNVLKEETVAQQRVLYDFFDTTALPFTISTKVVAIHERTKGYQLVRSGDLDFARFDEEKAAAVITSLFDVHKYNIKFTASSFEAYDLNANDTIDEASQLLNVEVPGIYSYRQITKLKML